MNRHPLRVAIIADYAEEGWPSMDLVAEMLVTHLAREHAGAIEPHLVRPPMRRRVPPPRAPAGAPTPPPFPVAAPSSTAGGSRSRARPPLGLSARTRAARR